MSTEKGEKFIQPEVLPPPGPHGNTPHAELQKVQGKTSAATRESILGRMSYQDAVDDLSSVFDLEGAREEAVKFHRRCGLVEALKKKGIVKDEDEYGALFDGVTFDRLNLNIVYTGLGGGSKMMPIFVPGHLTLVELWETNKEFERPETLKSRASFLSSLRIIDPWDISHLEQENAMKKKRDIVSGGQMSALREAYEKAPALIKPSGPRIVFTLDTIRLPKNKRTGLDELMAIKNEMAQFLGVDDDFIRKMTYHERVLEEIARRTGELDQLEYAHYEILLDKTLNDRSKFTTDKGTVLGGHAGTRCPLYVSPEGRMAGVFGFDDSVVPFPVTSGYRNISARPAFY